MRYQSLAAVCTAAALSLSTPAPAFAESPWHAEDTRSAALKWEIAYLALSAIDAAQTISCLDRGECKEGNPLFGKNPSSTKLILAKVGGGLAHFAVFKYVNDRDPKAALRLAQISFGIQGSVVMLNARFTF